MGKGKKYSNEELLDAVMKYADTHKCVIHYAKLAEWARENIEGMAGVRDYHFSRDETKTNSNGKKIEVPRECRLKIEELNKIRSIGNRVKTNPIFHSSRVDEILNLQRSIQIEKIEEARKTYWDLKRDNEKKLIEIDAITSQLKNCKEKQEELEEKIKTLEREQKRVSGRIRYILNTIDEDLRKEKLSEMGIEEEYVDIDRYAESLEESLEDVFNFNKTIEDYLSKISTAPLKIQIGEESKDVEIENVKNMMLGRIQSLNETEKKGD